MEAMASGCACVASNVGGIPDLIENGENGVLVEPKDVEGLAAAISKLIENSSLRQKFSEGAKIRASKDFAIKDSVAKTIDVYNKVLTS